MPADTDQLFAPMFEDASEAAYVIEPFEDRIVAANRAGCALLGYTREELLTTPVSEIHPADLPQVRDFVERVQRDGRGSTIKLTCRTKGGTFLPMEMSLVVLEDGDRMLALLRDRSEHRQREPS